MLKKQRKFCRSADIRVRVTLYSAMVYLTLFKYYVKFQMKQFLFLFCKPYEVLQLEGFKGTPEGSPGGT